MALLQVSNNTNNTLIQIRSSGHEFQAISDGLEIHKLAANAQFVDLQTQIDNINTGGTGNSGIIDGGFY